MIEREITTRSGVPTTGDPEGRVKLLLRDGDTIADLTVSDGKGFQVTVYLGVRELMSLMMACGAAANDL